MLKSRINKIKRKLYFHIPDRFRYNQSPLPNIFVFSSRRGGSTLLTELIASDPAFRYVDQPFDQTDFGIKKDIISRHIPKHFLSQYIDPGSDEDVIKKYLQSLLSGGIPDMSLMLKWPCSRTVIKICNGLALVDWIDSNFSDQKIYLVRHPVPQSFSVVRNNWQITSLAYLQSQKYKEILSEEQISYGLNLMQKGSMLEKSVLNWVMENFIPLKIYKIVTITYEDLVLNTEVKVNEIADYLTLSDRERMISVLKSPSMSLAFSNEKTLKAIENQDKEFLITKWQKELTNDQADRVQEILDVYNITEYSARNPYPNFS